MISLKEIQKPVNEHLGIVEQQFKDAMKSKIPLLHTITRFIIRRKGKQMRPLFVLLSADVCGGVNDSSYHAATLIELMHTATLIHDDVVDDSNQRRGFFSINALWKNKVAVLIGDYLLSRGLMLALDHREYNLLHIVSDATKEMAEGELLQIEKARRLDIEEDIYFDIIRKKTASLIASCCKAGATTAGTDEETIEKMRLFGEKTGIAFQIKDDLLDYQSSGVTGKPNGIDIKEKKLTLPVIYMLNNSSKSEKRSIIRTIRYQNNNRKKVEEIIEKVKASGGLEYAEKTMHRFKDEALEILDSMPESPSKESLKNLVYFTTDRKR